MFSENRLANEKSPYLLQHKNNPVDWFPWSEEAFIKAKMEDKPVFLSIGYSTCHWCHVMEQESFEDKEVAEQLNNYFVCVKVDREERPDLDHIYMAVCQMMTGSGGWPLTVIMTPEKKPFFAGTYFPKESRNNKIGMIDLTQKVNEIWMHNRDEINKSAEEITSYLQNQVFTNESEISEEIIKTAAMHFERNFDEKFGGFGNAPKFPTPHNLLFLLEFYPEIVEKTLKSLRNGGIFDQIGFGFHRYSTDRQWLVPHFEKMLYDQAGLLMVFAEAFRLTGNKIFEQTCREIFEYVIRDMTSEEGGFFSAEDADSEGKEGLFYLWTSSEIDLILTEKESAVIKNYLNIKNEGNFIDESSRILTGFNIPYIDSENEDTAQKYGLSEIEFKRTINQSLQKMFDYREKRIRPLRDEKILTDWNGLMIASLSYAGRILGSREMIISAIKSAEFILEKLFDSNTKDIFHRYRENESAIIGNLDDYSYFIWGLIELYQSTFDEEYLITAIDLTQKLEDEFLDENEGGYFFVSEKVTDVIVRKKIIYDGAIPSGNSVHLNNLFKLYLITGEKKYLDSFDNLKNAFSDTIAKNPFLYTHFLSAVKSSSKMPHIIIIAGDMHLSENHSRLDELYKNVEPDTIILNVNSKSNKLLSRIPYLKNYKVSDGKLLFFACKGNECSLPVENIDDIFNLIYK